MSSLVAALSAPESEHQASMPQPQPPAPVSTAAAALAIHIVTSQLLCYHFIPVPCHPAVGLLETFFPRHFLGRRRLLLAATSTGVSGRPLVRSCCLNWPRQETDGTSETWLQGLRAIHDTVGPGSAYEDQCKTI